MLFLSGCLFITFLLFLMGVFENEDLKVKTCADGHHVWPVEWKCVYDEDGTITGFWYQECTEVGCFHTICVFNFDESPETTLKK